MRGRRGSLLSIAGLAPAARKADLVIHAAGTDKRKEIPVTLKLDQKLVR